MPIQQMNYSGCVKDNIYIYIYDKLKRFWSSAVKVTVYSVQSRMNIARKVLFHVTVACVTGDSPVADNYAVTSSETSAVACTPHV